MSRQPEIAVAVLEDARAAIRLLFRPHQVIELRAFGLRGVKVKKRFTLSGYYDDHDRMAEDVIKMSNTSGVTGVFWTLQTIKPALLARSANRYIEGPAATTSDADVAWYSWLPIDCDPMRPSGVSATDTEKAKALEVMEHVAALFREQGVTTVCADSGNGFHLLVAIQLGVKEAPLVASVLTALDERFSTEDAKIDRVNFNPARIFKAYGTVARKGEASGERPHRVARLLSIPDAIPTCASRELLETIAAAAPPTQKRRKGKKSTAIDLEVCATKLEQFLNEGRIKHGVRADYKDGFKWLLQACPFNAEHTEPSIIVTISDSGAFGFRCLHNSCFDRHWKDFREFAEAQIGHTFEFTEKAAADDGKKESARDFANIALVYQIAHSKDPAWLEAEFQRLLPKKYETRNRVKGMCGGKTYIRHSIERFLEAKYVQTD
jgi:hypothetical protein